MRLRIHNIILCAVRWHRGSYISLGLVVALIAAVITASLLAGYSVRATLTANTVERLNGSGFMVSAGLRYSDRDVAAGIEASAGAAVAPLLELNGHASGFGGDRSLKGVKIWGTDSLFFLMGGVGAAETPGRGEAIVSSRVAEALQIKEGDNIIVRFAPPSDLPRNTPFAPEKEEEGSLFLTVKKTTTDENYALFNPSISQLLPNNIFVNIDEFNQFFEGRKKANRFLIQHDDAIEKEIVEKALTESSLPGGQSLRIRQVPATGETEIVSDRIFIDDFVVKRITDNIPGAEPVITYLSNTISSASGSTPYSFISALSGSAVTMLNDPFDILINEWLAADLKCATGDSVTVTYYLSGSDSQLTESSSRFRVAGVVPQSGVWRDSLLMPAFPGITGSRSCTDWDAGIPLDMNLIREKDEDYWFDYAGTPKAFIQYETGAALWGNQFGPATAIRVEPAFAGTSSESPGAWGIGNEAWGVEYGTWGTYGFTVSDLRTEGLRAASSGVDFSSLFLALSLFITGSALVLLIMITDNHLRSREGEMATYTALGFLRTRIRLMFLGEAIIPVTIGSLMGAGAGLFFNSLIIAALNSVWIGAVQTDTLRAFSGTTPLLTGFLTTLIVALLTVTLRIGSYLKNSGESVRMRSVPDGRVAAYMIVLLLILTAVQFILIAFTSLNSVMLWFIAGTLIFALIIVEFRWLLTRRFRKYMLSLRYYAFYPSRAVTPVIFIAAGLFIVISTGANRKDFSNDVLRRSSGTGGFTHWIETTIPVETDINLPGAVAVMHCLRVDGDDASCLNLNFVTSPHLLGVDAQVMKERESFSFASGLKGVTDGGFWEVLPGSAGPDAVYGFLDQTVMQWGMKVKPGDTVTVRSESGEALHVIIAGGFKTSVFQGHLVIDKSHFKRWFPSVAGSNVLLAEMASTEESGDWSPGLKDMATFESYGATVETTPSRMESFNRVTNTYLSVFVVLGGIGMILGVTGMGLNLVRNIRSRRKEFALLAASGFSGKRIRRMLISENTLILIAGVAAGTIPALIATWPSLISGNGLPWSIIAGLLMIMIVTGMVATIVSARALNREKVLDSLRKEK